MEILTIKRLIITTPSTRLRNHIAPAYTSSELEHILSCRELDNSETLSLLWLTGLFARNPNPPKQTADCADRTSEDASKGNNAAMERFLSEDDHLKKSLVVGKDHDKQKEATKSSALGKDHMLTELNKRDGRQH